MKTHDEVDKIEKRLREVEASLESIAREVCGDPNGGKVYEALRYAVTDVGDAIRASFRMRPDEALDGTEMASSLNEMAAQKTEGEHSTGKWTATFLEMNGSEIRSFGNVGGFLYPSSAMAWEACVKDYKATQEAYPKAKSYVDTRPYRIELWNDKVYYVWEIQKVVDYAETQGVDAPAWTDSVEEACEKLERERAS